MTSPWWAILVGSLGGALVGFGASFSSIYYQQHRIDKREAKAARSQAYLQLFSRSMTLAIRAETLTQTARLRSGWRENLDVAFRLRPAADPMYRHDWLDADFNPAIEAWSGVWMGAPQAVVAKANALLNCCIAVVAAATTRPEQSAPQRVMEFVVGARADPSQVKRIQTAQRALAAARRDFAMLVREETGQEYATLFLAT